MKTHAYQMKNEFVEFLESLGIGWKYLINGLIGGVIWSMYKKSKFWESLRQVVIGGVVSAYSTPVILAKTGMDLAFVGFTSFIVGMMGMIIVDNIYKYVLDKIKKWKDAIIFINKQK